MFQNPVFIYGIVALIVVVVLVLIVGVIPRNRKKHFENRFTIELENQGNVDAHYLLRLDNLQHIISYSFRNEDGQVLDCVEWSVTEEPAMAGGRVGASGSSSFEKADTAASLVGQFGPSAVSKPIANVKNDVFAATSFGQQIAYYLSKIGIKVNVPTASLSGSSDSINSADVVETAPAVETWWRTEGIAPGKKQAVTLNMHRKFSGNTSWNVRVISRAAEDPESQDEIAKEAYPRPGFWAAPVWPELLVAVLGIAAVSACLLVFII